MSGHISFLMSKPYASLHSQEPLSQGSWKAGHGPFALSMVLPRGPHDGHMKKQVQGSLGTGIPQSTLVSHTLLLSV